MKIISRNQSIIATCGDDDDYYVSDNGGYLVLGRDWYPPNVFSEISDITINESDYDQATLDNLTESQDYIVVDGALVATDKKLLDDIRAKRDILLKRSDTDSRIIFADVWSSANTEFQDMWTTYRQQLRDLPQTIDLTLDEVQWPDEPARYEIFFAPAPVEADVDELSDDAPIEADVDELSDEEELVVGNNAVANT